ncbi:hypothetical protein GCM10010193_63330 [Kitasatospora atroaurantiaca]|uniref:Tn3 transposase DDE domain-containing protein n=1 Tax=Kitasatospora atroaurantiaca TaxID=285545 RepID=A0A561EIP1_9ACTN|nr:Tn3 transposase DDE domain-containing protein [Kitasatospora atroaurantiaca]
MIEGLLRHCTDADIESNYVDTHGASVVGFAFTELLNFRLLPRLKNIGSIRLSLPDDGPPSWPALGGSLTRAIKWDLIAQQYDQMVMYATALRLGTAEAEQVLNRRGLTALFWSNINPYGTFRLDMDTRLDLSTVTVPDQRARSEHVATAE